MSSWLSLPGPPLLLSTSQPYLVDAGHQDEFLDHVGSRGARSVVVEVPGATSAIDVIGALKAKLEFPGWCGSGWDSVDDAFEELRAAWSCPLVLLLAGLDRLMTVRPQLALETILRLEELSRAFARAGDQLVVAYVWEAPGTSFSDYRISLQRALWGVIPPNLRAVAVGSHGGIWTARFIFEDLPGEDELEVVYEVECEVVSDFPVTVAFDFRASSDRGPLKFEVGESWWAYVRREHNQPWSA